MSPCTLEKVHGHLDGVPSCHKRVFVVLFLGGFSLGTWTKPFQIRPSYLGVFPILLRKVLQSLPRVYTPVSKPYESFGRVYFHLNKFFDRGRDPCGLKSYRYLPFEVFIW